jgi:hypothetical protein
MGITALADESTLKDVTEGRAGHRARLLRVAREGLPHFDGEGVDASENAQAVGRKRRDIVQYRACVALGWGREQIMEETGWSHQHLMAAEQFVKDEDRKIWGQADPVGIFSEYREQQLLCAKELEDLAIVFRNGRQFSALVGAVKARSEILDKVVKAGQELGLIKRAAREISLHGSVDVRSLSISELRVHLQKEVSGLRKILDPPNQLEGTAGVVLNRILGAKAEPAPKPAKPTVPAPRVKQLAPEKP